MLEMSESSCDSSVEEEDDFEPEEDVAGPSGVRRTERQVQVLQEESSSYVSTDEEGCVELVLFTLDLKLLGECTHIDTYGVLIICLDACNIDQALFIMTTAGMMSKRCLAENPTTMKRKLALVEDVTSSLKNFLGVQTWDFWLTKYPENLHVSPAKKLTISCQLLQISLDVYDFVMDGNGSRMGDKITTKTDYKKVLKKMLQESPAQALLEANLLGLLEHDLTVLQLKLQEKKSFTGLICLFFWNLRFYFFNYGGLNQDDDRAIESPASTECIAASANGETNCLTSSCDG
ncbi:hypothetical protein J437_LFUL007446 [Ladona fulva]|uniref:Uncharacterized protein n=1 Tax=Ladona fulva TaxID=123851 RepID=A0A8K0KC35_LADFU|nr:hypothetical protein J437_LFUL007446 [Ladona fulva]